MTRLDAVNLIRLFDFYLAAMFVLGLTRRYGVYWDVLRFAVALRGRWPKLVDRIRLHRGVLVTRDVLRPLAVAVGLMLVQWICSRLIWPHAVVPVGEVLAHWWMLLAVGVAVAPMVGVDGYFLVRVGRFDRGETEQYLDYAENWLRTWKAPAIRVVTLGYVDPHRIVDTELRKGLTQLGATVGWAAWWMSVQIACRMAFGLTIWTLWAVTRDPAG